MNRRVGLPNGSAGDRRRKEVTRWSEETSRGRFRMVCGDCRTCGVWEAGDAGRAANQGREVGE